MMEFGKNEGKESKEYRRLSSGHKISFNQGVT